ncbi:MAG: hypothetical protein R3C42_05015 [Parvularculaceae bacterium]
MKIQIRRRPVERPFDQDHPSPQKKGDEGKNAEATPPASAFFFSGAIRSVSSQAFGPSCRRQVPGRGSVRRRPARARRKASVSSTGGNPKRKRSIPAHAIIAPLSVQYFASGMTAAISWIRERG